MRRKEERSKQGQTNKQGKATQHTQDIHVYMHVHVATVDTHVHVHEYTTMHMRETVDGKGRRNFVLMEFHQRQL